jgi:hypothetical protein
MAPRPHDGSEPDETRPESDDPGHDDVPQPEPDGLADPEVEARWMEIITQLDQSDDDDVVRGDARSDRDVVVLDAEVGAGRDPDEAGQRGDPIEADPRGWVAPDLDEHFEPPDPGPVFGGDPLLTMAWVAVVGPLVLLLISVFAWRDIPAVALQIAAASFLIGVGILIWRMPATRDEDDGPGAVV